MEKHTILADKVKLYKRDRSRYWQCSTFHAGREHRKSTKESSLAKAKEFAEDWYFDIRAGIRAEKKQGKTFKQLFTVFERDFLAVAHERNADYVNFTIHRLKRFVIPFLGDDPVKDISAARVQEYRHHRRSTFKAKHGREISRSTLDKDVIAIGQVLKAALREGLITHMPDLAEPYKASSKVKPRPWFSPREYRTFYEATRRRTRHPIHKKHMWAYHELHDLVLFLANTGLRPDEVNRLRYKDVQIIDDEDTNERILLISVQRGKRGVGYCKSTKGAVRPFERMLDRNSPDHDDIIFAGQHRDLFNTILEEEGLKYDEHGQGRTYYSLRHTYICFRLMEGADIYQIAKNCRTSVEMIEKYYASHIQNTLNAAAINVARSH